MADLQTQAQLYFDYIPQEYRSNLDHTLDFAHDGVENDLGEIADTMDEWEGKTSTALGLTKVDGASIKTEHPKNLSLQTRAALRKWKQRRGLKSTYRNLIFAFLEAGKSDCAEAVCRVLGGKPVQMQGTMNATQVSMHPSAVVQRVQAVDGEGEENFQSIRIEEKDKQKLKGHLFFDDLPNQNGKGSEHHFRCPCGTCNLDFYLDNGCPETTSQTYPYLELSRLTENEKEDLVQKLSNDTANIIESFADLITDTSESLRAKNIEVGVLVSRALNIGAYKSDRVQKPLLAEDEHQLLQADTIDMVFIILRRHMSFFNYEILAYIIRKLGDDTDKGNLSKYYRQFRTFCERKIFEVPPSVFASSTDDDKKGKLFVVLVTEDIIEKLHDVKVSQRRIATLLNLRSSTLKLYRIDKASILLVFSVPHFVAKHIFPLSVSMHAQLMSEGFAVITSSPELPLHVAPMKKPSLLLNQDISLQLTINSYKRKFRALLDCEEKTHAEILETRCSGRYRLVLYQSGLKMHGPNTKEYRFQHVRYGYLLGLNGDKIAYAVQAAQDKHGVVLLSDGINNEVCRADILPENYSHIDEKMYIGFDRENHQILLRSAMAISASPKDCHIFVHFELKHQYFMSLRRFVHDISQDVICKLIPSKIDFHKFERNNCFEGSKALCSADQLKALESIAFSPSNGPPILIVGPFGTGKTHTLAVAAHTLFHEARLTNQSIKILVCTHHKRSADNFLEIFKDLHQCFPLNRGIETFLIRDYGTETTSWQVRQYCINSKKILYHIHRHPERDYANFLCVTTCMSCSRLSTLNGFFTHIMIDEGAQMREPEVIAPLCLADRNTKIIITGDHHQVGPSVLVFGDQARQYGLATSLLERLSSLYGGIAVEDEVIHGCLVTLSTNFRCHPIIRTFARNLFYHEFDLKSPKNFSLPSPHPSYYNCLVFVCSDTRENVNEVNSNVNECEAQVLLKILKEVAFLNWPKEWGERDLSKCCIMSPCRSQLTIINQIVRDWRKGYNVLKHVSRRPTYDIQGREFRAVFLSTAEPIADGKILNPTKSFSNRYVFNTAITRAQSLIIGVGNPFLLLKMEKHMMETYGYDERGKCWSNYLKKCLSNKTVQFDNLLNLSTVQKENVLKELREAVDKQLKQGCSAAHTSQMKNDAFLSATFPPVPVVKVNKRRSKYRRKQKSNLENSPQVITVSSNTPAHTTSMASLAITKHETKNYANYVIDPNAISSLPRSRLIEEFQIVGEMLKGDCVLQCHVVSIVQDQEYGIELIPLPTSETRREKMEKQAQLICHLNHPHIIKCYNWWTEHKQSLKTLLQESYLLSDAILTLQTELVTERYTLEHWLKHNIFKRMKMTVLNFFEQILDAITYISQYTHEGVNLKPCNIFLDPNKDDFLKIGDTGLITGCSTSENDRTSFFYSPEQTICGEDGDIKADIYALGVILFELNCPFVSDEDKIEVLTELKQRGIPGTFKTRMHSEVTSLINLLLTKNMVMRPSAREVMEDKFNHLKNLKKKVRRSKTPHVPVLSLGKAIMHQRNKSQEEDVSILLNHLVLGPPALFQIECPVCKDILKIPYQTDCCGKIFCQTCIQQTKTAREGCPTCNQLNYNIFPDRGLQVALQQLQIHCPNVKEGCKWKGFLKEVDRHLNLSPSVGKQLDGCQCVQIQCLYCSTSFCRSKMSLHQNSQCPKRPYTCQFCSNYTSVYSDVKVNHWPICESVIIQCENKCGEKIPKMKYKNHIENQCMEATMMCTYFDCDLVLSRKNMLAHMIDAHTPSDVKILIQQASQLQIEAVERKYHSHIQYQRVLGVNSQKFQVPINKGHEEKKSLTKDKYKDRTVRPQITPRFIIDFPSTKTQQPTIESLVQPPQEAFLNIIECPVCLRIVSEPYQVTCCGKNLCKECISTTNQQCPNCTQVANSFYNKGLHRVLSDFYVCCPNKKHSCEWRGKLSDLNTHLNPGSEHPHKGCEYAQVTCQDCSGTYARHLHTEHKSKLCQMRPFICTYCNTFKSSYDDVTANHWHICSKYLLRCPRKCGTTVERQNLANHLSNQCLFRQKTFHIGIWCMWVTLILFFLCMFPVWFLIPSLAMTKVRNDHIQELSIHNQEWNQNLMCQEWIFSTLTLTVNFYKTQFKGVILIECELRDIKQEWKNEFEFGSATKIISTNDMHKVQGNIDFVFKSITALQELQLAISQAQIWALYLSFTPPSRAQNPMNSDNCVHNNILHPNK